MGLFHPAKLLAALVACLIVAMVAAGCGGDDADEGAGVPADGDALRIGSVFSVSGAGVAFGPQQLRAARLAAEEVNDAGGIDGARLEIVQRDDGSDPERTPDAMRELIEDEEVLAVLGPTFSNAAATGHPLADELGVPMLAVSNTGPGIVGQCSYPCELVFRNSLGEEAALPANMDSLLVGDEEISAGVVAYPVDDPFAKRTGGIAARNYVSNAVTSAEFEFADPEELESLPGSPQALVVTASSGETAAAAIRSAREGGYEGPIMGGNALNSRLAAEEAGAAGEGARSAAAWYSGNEDEANAEFVDAYREAYDEEPDQFAAQAYTGVLLLAEAAREGLAAADGGLAAERRALARALERVEMPTPLGDFRFTADHDVSQPIWIVEMDGRGGYDLVERLDPEPGAE